MLTVTRIVKTDKPVETVASFLTDFANTQVWDPGTVSCHQVDPGPIVVGTLFENVSQFGGRTTTLTYRVIAIDPGRSISLEGTGKGIHAVDSMTFVPAGTGTEVTYRAEFTFTGVAGRLGVLLKIPLDRLADKAAAGMREALARL